MHQLYQKPLDRALTLSLVAAGIVLAVTLSVTSTSQAMASHGDLGWVWGSNTWASSGVYDHTVASGWYTAIITATVDWRLNTAITPNFQSSGTREHHYYDGSYGASGVRGWANVYSGLTGCASGGTVTGNCNKTNTTATMSLLYLNNDVSPSAAEKVKVASHELGHAYGLSHSHPSSCWPQAVMNISVWDDDITAVDIGHVAELY